MPIKTSVKLLILFSIILVTSIAYKNALAVTEIAIKQPFTVKLKPKIKVALEFANKYENIDELLAAVINQILSSRDPGHRTITFIPIQTLKGSTSKAITVGQRGTFTEVYNAPNQGDKFFQAGDTYILFLTLESARSDNFYWTTGAVQGAFQVKSDRVNYPQIKSESLDDFLRTIQTKVKSINSN